MNEFCLTTEWHLDANSEAIWKEITDTAEWPSWWRYVQDVRQIEGTPDGGAGSVYLVDWTSRLPYKIKLAVKVLEAHKPQMIRVEATGDLEGSGTWQLIPALRGTRVRYTWRVDLRKNWMRTFSFALAPMFRWNHDAVMQQGGLGLARRLNVELLSHNALD
jgi:uncharacterized protein YndB with AHSA1/START domain